MQIRPLEPRDRTAIGRFVERIPEGDRTFFKENVAEADTVERWMRPGVSRSVAVDGDSVVGYVAVVPLQGWSSHVGEVRLIVDPERRGEGIGRALARHAVEEALRLGLSKMVVEVIADQDSTIALFRSHGFDPEALLVDHVRDQSGELRDLMILAHSVEGSLASLSTTGLADAADEE
jgi:ribosomal protein S18 acetylase RimI-like enzyme